MGDLFKTIVELAQIYRRREDHPRIEFEVDVRVIGIHKNFYLVELLAYIDNKGLIAFKLEPEDFYFSLFALMAKDEIDYIVDSSNKTNEKDLESGSKKIARIKFPTTLMRKRWLPWHTFLEPNVRQKYSYHTAVPNDCSYLLLWGKFIYDDDKADFHTAEKIIKVPQDPKERDFATLEELTISTMYEAEAVINILERKGLLTKDEVLEEIKVLSRKK